MRIYCCNLLLDPFQPYKLKRGTITFQGLEPQIPKFLIPMSLPDPLIRLIEELQRLPGIGPKGAQRLAFHILKAPREQVNGLSDALRELKERVT